MILEVLPVVLEICSVPRDKMKEIMHPLLDVWLFEQSRPEFFCVAETPVECSFIVDVRFLAKFPNSISTTGKKWRPLLVTAGEQGLGTRLLLDLTTLLASNRLYEYR